MAARTVAWTSTVLLILLALALDLSASERSWAARLSLSAALAIALLLRSGGKLADSSIKVKARVSIARASSSARLADDIVFSSALSQRVTAASANKFATTIAARRPRMRLISRLGGRRMLLSRSLFNILSVWEANE